MADISKQKSKPHEVLKRIKYRSGYADSRYIDPGEEVVTMEHLDDSGYALLVKLKYIAPVKTKSPAKDGK